MAGVEAVTQHNGALRLTLAADTHPQDILGQLLLHHTAVERFEIAIPTLDEIFIRTVSEKATG
jgi:ABC-2 type transport system ATP-binding protein